MNLVFHSKQLPDYIEWSEFVKNHHDGNVFQTPEMYEFYKKTKNYTPLLIYISDDNNIIGLLLAVIIKENGIQGKIFTKRSIIFGGPLVKNNDTEILDAILKGYSKKVRKIAIYSEFRNHWVNDKKVKSIFLKNGYHFYNHLNFIVDCKCETQVYQKLSKSKKRQISKSLKNGASIKEADSIEEVMAFYKILEGLYRMKIRIPLPSLDFFINFFNSSLGKYYVIILNKKVIGGIMCPIYQRKKIYEWYICGEDGKYKGVYPSVLASWAPIDYAVKNKIEKFDFMGAGKPNEGYGVREFKSKFGGELHEYGRFHRVNNKILYFIGKNAILLKKKLKL